MTSSRRSAASAACTLDGPPSRWRVRTSADSSSRPSSSTTARSDGALRERQPLPQRLEHRLLLGQQTAQRLVQVVERRAALAGGAHFIPRLVRKPLHVVGQVAGEVDDRAHRARAPARMPDSLQTGLR